MKLFLFVILASSSAFAFTGMAKFDKEVAELREAFVSAKVPNHGDLRLGKKWSCVVHDTYYNNRETFNADVVFQLTNVNSIVMLTGQDFIKGFYHEKTREWFTYFIPSEEGLQAPWIYQDYSFRKGLFTFRTLSDGNLVFEEDYQFWKILILQDLVYDKPQVKTPDYMDHPLTHTISMGKCTPQ